MPVHQICISLKPFQHNAPIFQSQSRHPKHSQAWVFVVDALSTHRGDWVARSHHRGHIQALAFECLRQIVVAEHVVDRLLQCAHEMRLIANFHDVLRLYAQANRLAWHQCWSCFGC